VTDGLQGCHTQQSSTTRHPQILAEAKLETVYGSNRALCELLYSKGVRSLGDVIYLAPWELRDWLMVSEDVATSVISLAWDAFAVNSSSAWDFMERAACNVVPIPLTSLSEAAGGGLSGLFVEVAGAPGVGKTQLCSHTAALTAAQGGEVFWLDTERTFSPPRILELLEAIFSPSAGNAKDLALGALKRIRARICSSLQELDSVVAELVVCSRRGDSVPALVVVDSIAALARNSGDALAKSSSVIPARQRALNALASKLKMLVDRPAAQKLTAPAVIVTNQVMGDPVGGGTKVALGLVWHHAVNWRLVLSCGSLRDGRNPECRRLLHVEKSPCAAPFTIRYAITHRGVEEVFNNQISEA